LMLDDGIHALFDVAADPGGTVTLLDGGSTDAQATAARLQELGEVLRSSR